MIHLGDITQIHGYDAPAVDCIIGGSPCQDLSVAGKREGLAGARSGLFMEQIRIVKEMRERDRFSGRTGQFVRPRYMVWENVPGAFSSNEGEDFRAVLEETARVADADAAIPRPPKKWANAGCIMGDGWSIAWHVLDAQFWGVPQRRRRIALVADFGGHTAPEILFERNSVCGNPPQGGEAGQGTAGDFEDGAGKAVAWYQNGSGECFVGSKAKTVQTNSNASGRGMQMLLQPQTYSTKLGNGEAVGSDVYNGNLTGNVSATLTAAMAKGGTMSGPTVCCDMTHATDVIRECGETAPTLQSRMGNGGNQVPLTFSMQGFGDYKAGEIASSYKKRDYKDSTDLIASVDCRNGAESEVNGTLQAKPSGGQSLNLNNVVRTGYAVRRLTPLECERLQGFPDGWTDIGAWTDTAGKLHKESSDSARYKALGNSIALPPWKWVLKRLCAFYERDATMASLFDGIGGFPLIWEQLNGMGTCLWASEIEEFPIAVTKRRFCT